MTPSIGAGTVLMPFAGKYQLTPEEAMVAKLPVLHGRDRRRHRHGLRLRSPASPSWSPFHGAAYAVVESLAKLAAVGARSPHAPA